MLAQAIAQLPAVCREVFGPSAHVVRCDDITAGAESRIFSVDVVPDAGADAAPVGLVLKLYSSDEGARSETNLLRALDAQRFPVPRLFASELDAKTFEQPFGLMQRIEGQTLGAVMRAALREEVGQWLRRFAELAARLHALDSAAFVAAPKSAGEHLDDALARGARALRELEVPEFQPVFDWLLEQRRGLSVRGPALVHHDYHPLNVMVDGQGELHVIDWTIAHVSDPRTDLAQTFQMLASSGFGALRAPIISAYEAASGCALADMAFFDVFALLKNIAGQYAVLDDGENKRPALWARLSRRPGWPPSAKRLRAMAGPLERTYQAMHALCGVRVPAAEQLFAGLGD
jgi:aminoglycoside phosphotransferase (APT) family kinase protein